MAGGTGVEGTFYAMVIEICANVAVSGGGQWERVIGENSGSGGGDPVFLSDLDLDNIVPFYN